MIFSKIIKDNIVDINKMLLNKYTELNINETECILLMHLFELHQNNKKSASLSVIKKKSNMKRSLISETLESLISKGLISLDLVNQKKRKKKIVKNIIKGEYKKIKCFI